MHCQGDGDGTDACRLRPKGRADFPRPPEVTFAAAAITTAVGALWKFLAQFEQMVQRFRVEPGLKLTRLFLQVGGAAIFWQTRLVYGTEPRMKQANARKLKSEAQPQPHNHN